MNYRSFERRERSKKWIKKPTRVHLLLAGVGILSVIAPVITHPRNAAHILTGSLDCRPHSMQSMPIDAMAIANGGHKKTENGTYRPNANTNRRLQAAAYWYIDQVNAGTPPRSIHFYDAPFQPGSAGVNDFYFREYVDTFSDGGITVPRGITFTDATPLNTTQTAQAIARDTKRYNFGSVALFSDQAHITRFSALTCAHGVPSVGFSAEDVIKSHNPSRVASIDKWLSSAEQQKYRFREFSKRLSLLWFPSGDHLTRLKIDNVNNR
jgi:hypothetical protein